MLWRRSRSRCASGKSSPITATICTWVYWLAASEKNVAAPPSTSLTSPNGVRTVSSAIEPTTTRLIKPPSVSGRDASPPPRALELRPLERAAAGTAARRRDARDQRVQQLLQARVVLIEDADHLVDGHGGDARLALHARIVVGDQRHV